MGWNETRVFMLPPTRRPTVQEVPGTRTMAGRPLQILDSIRDEGLNGTPLPLESLARWLEQRGFAVSEKHAKGLSLRRNDIEVSLCSEDGELASADLTFTLNSDSPARWGCWQTFVNDFCQAWNLGLVDSDHQAKVGPAQLLRRLGETVAWKEFADHFGWSSEAMAGVPTWL